MGITAIPLQLTSDEASSNQIVPNPAYDVTQGQGDEAVQIPGFDYTRGGNTGKDMYEW